MRREELVRRCCGAAVLQFSVRRFVGSSVRWWGWMVGVGFLLAMSNGAIASRDGISLEVNPRTITVGDPVEVNLSLTPPEGAKVALPAPDSFAPAEVLRVDTLKWSERQVEVKYLLSVFEPGKTDLPAVPVIYVMPNHADTFAVELGNITVNSVLAEGDSLADIRDIRPPVRLAWTFKDLLPWLIGMAAVLVLGLSAYLIWRRYAKKAGLIQEWKPAPLPPDELALQRLENLRIRKLWQDGYLKEFYSELTDIVKEYIGGRWGFNAPEMTTAELLDARGKWQVEDGDYTLIRRMLTCADMVKFARFKPDAHENETQLDAGFKFVKFTQPVAMEDRLEQPAAVETTSEASLA